MNEYRITKYNPLNRNELGHYLNGEEWTEYSDVGKKVSLEEYLIVEESYIQSILELIDCEGLTGIAISCLEDSDGKCSFNEQDFIPKKSVGRVIKSILRNEYWCKLQSNTLFVHFGYDFYMYVGTAGIHTIAIDNIKQRGLYVENMVSPYHPENS